MSKEPVSEPGKKPEPVQSPEAVVPPVEEQAPAEAVEKAETVEAPPAVEETPQADDHQPVSEAGFLSFASLFVRRPILALVFNALIVVAGLAAYYGIEVRELPNVDRPVINVRTTLKGASPETIERQITDVIEGAVARVAGLKSMSSNSLFSSSRVTLEFSSETDLAVAAADVRDAISQVQNDLPDDADDPRIIKADADSQPVLRLAVVSQTLPREDLTILVEDRIAPLLAAVAGVADVETYGDKQKVFRIDIDQAKLASRGVSVADLAKALGNLTFDVPAGSLSNASSDLLVRATAEIRTPADFAILQLNDRVRLGDVASITIGPEAGTSSLRSNGRPGVGMGVIRQAQSNTLAISDGIRAAVKEINKTLPEGTTIAVTSDDATFIRGSIHEVINALLLAVIIVVGVIYLFLRDARATFIPAVTMPVALIGTLAALYLVGFSINILTLLAIVLATGMVVDDAIVVLENIVRRRSEGMGPWAAAVIGTGQVFFAVVATTVTLAAVFVPLSFLPSQAGGLFREFGFALAISVTLSGLVALTLCPMLASRMLEKPPAHGRGPLVFIGNMLAGFYRRTLSACLNAPLAVFTLASVFVLAGALVFFSLNQELTPQEDRSIALMRVNTANGVSLAYTDDQMAQIEERIAPLIQSGEVINVFSITGFGSSSNSGFMVLTLAPWEKRVRSQNEIVGDINKAVAGVPGVQARAIQPNSLGIRGAGQGLQVAITGNDYAALDAAALTMIDAMEKSGKFDQVRRSNEPTQSQLSVTVDRERAADMGIPIDGLSDVLQAMLDGRSIGDVFVDGRRMSVLLVSTSNPVNDPGDLENIFLKTGDGRVVPMSVIATVTEKAVSPRLARENQLRAVPITASAKSGVSLGEALSTAEGLAKTVLPAGMGLIPLAEAATLNESSGSMAITFGFAILVIFLVLAAQFESVISAITIMITVPLGLVCAVFALKFTGMSINIYSQIGLVMLVGIMAKNGILIVEFANQLRDEGQERRAAIMNACMIRLRPVMMTMISTVLGGLPLVLAHGAGAEARVALGYVIVGGLGLATIVTLYVTPVAWLVLSRFSGSHAKQVARLDAEIRAAAE